MGGHEISIKSIFDFRTSLPINEILYIQYIIRQYRYMVSFYMRFIWMGLRNRGTAAFNKYVQCQYKHE
jgi:hypothetical protein